MRRRAFGRGVLLVTFLALVPAASAVGPADDAEQAVVRFHAALAAGERAAALALLAADAIVIENGKVESRTDYAARHLADDIDFARGTKVERTKPRTVVEGHTAWVSSVSTVKGESKGRPVKLVNAELMVLALHQGRWLIRAIHWSSRALSGVPPDGRRLFEDSSFTLYGSACYARTKTERRVAG